MSRLHAQERVNLRCFPRVSGDEPQDIDGVMTETEFSPRERG